MEEHQLNESRSGQGYADVKYEAASLEESYKEQSENLDQQEQNDENVVGENNNSQAIDEQEKNNIIDDSKQTEEKDLAASQVEEEEEEQEGIDDKEKSNSSIDPEKKQNEDDEEMQQEHSSDKKEGESNDNQESQIQEEENDGEEEEDGNDHQSSMNKPITAPKIEEEEIKQALFLENFIREYQHQQQIKESDGKTSTGGNNSEKLLGEGPMITAQQETQILQMLMEQLKYQQQQNSQQQKEQEQNGEHVSKQTKSEGIEKEDEAMREEEDNEDEEIDQKEAEDEEEVESQQQQQNQQLQLEKQLQNEKLNIAGYQQLEEETVMALINQANKLQAYLSSPQLTEEQKTMAEQKQAACLLQLKKLQQLIHAESLNPALLLQSLSASKQEQQSKILEQQQHHLLHNATANNSVFKNEQQSHQNYQNHPLVNFFNSYSLFINETAKVQLDQEIVLNKLIENATKCKPPSNADDRVNVLWQYLTNLDKQQIESFENQLRSLPEQNIYECIQTIEKLHIKLLVEYNMEVARGKNLGIIKQ